MQHPDEGTIHAWLDGALSADEAATVEAHVNGCAQCQAAVAEARGFIAASSRILTALDNVPSGVVPVAKPKRRDRMAAWVSGFRPTDPMMWRIAATLLVVAAGTLVVVRNSGVETRSSADSQVSTSAPAQDSASSKALETAATAAPSVATPQAQVAAPTEKKAAATERRQAIRLGRGGGGSVAGAVASPNSRADRDEARNRAAPVPALPAPAAAAPPQFQAMAERANVLAGDLAAAEPVIRVVGTPRATGQKITLYEVAPGDTVRLVEPLTVALDAVVVTGASETRMQAGQAKATTGARATTTAAAPMAKVATPTEAGTNTISWTDSTGRVMKLSGRHTLAELEAIRRKIEHLKASSTPVAPCPSSDSLCRRR